MSDLPADWRGQLDLRAELAQIDRERAETRLQAVSRRGRDASMSMWLTLFVFVFILSVCIALAALEMPTDATRAACDKQVAVLLTTRDAIEMERARIITDRLDCSFSRRL
jgi:hypothetical protein